MTDFFHAADGARLAYDDTGTGHPLLCLCGLTRNMADFDPVVAAFAPSARVIRMDYRGRGQSDFTGAETYTLVQEAQDALGLLDHLGLDKVSILGTSRGGLIAMALAMTNRERLNGVILNDIGPVIAPEGMSYIMTYLGSRPPYKTYAEAMARMPKAIAPRFVNVSEETLRAHIQAIWKETDDGSGLDICYDPALRDAVIAVAEAGDTPDLWPMFEALRGLPLSLIRGANSDLLSAETTTDMQQRLPEMEVAEVPDRGHVPFLDEPEAQALIARYLGRVT